MNALSQCFCTILDTVTLEEEKDETMELVMVPPSFKTELHNHSNTPGIGISILLRVMILASTYRDSDKVYLTRKIRSHPIWQCQYLWESMLEDGLKNALKDELSWDEVPPDMRHDEVGTVHFAIFNQLATILLNQVEFGVPTEEIERFLFEKCAKSNLCEQQASLLITELTRSIKYFCTVTIMITIGINYVTFT